MATNSHTSAKHDWLSHSAAHNLPHSATPPACLSLSVALVSICFRFAVCRFFRIVCFDFITIFVLILLLLQFNVNTLLSLSPSPSRSLFLIVVTHLFCTNSAKITKPHKMSLDQQKNKTKQESEREDCVGRASESVVRQSSNNYNYTPLPKKPQQLRRPQRAEVIKIHNTYGIVA